MIACLMSITLALTLPADSVDRLARAESLLVAGNLDIARKELERYLRDDETNPQALILLGRVHFEWPVIGRFKAWRLFERAARHDPDNPEPRYWQARVGLFLGSADGERLARDGLFHLWDLVPTYRDSWTIWAQLYRGDKHRRQAIAALARHAGDPSVDIWRARLFIELERWHDADRILTDLLARGHGSVTVWALRAQGALEAGDSENGLDYYEQALERVALDSSDFLWSQVAAIASSEEDSAYHATAHDDRAAFFRAFWSRREPDLTTDVNERIGEHFERMRHARRQFALLHPLNSFHRSPLRRALSGALASTVAVEFQSSGFGAAFLRPQGALARSIESMGLAVDVRDLPEPDSLTRYRRFGLDGRGLLYLRFGKPTQVYRAGGPNLGELESWRYVVDGQSVIVPFARATAGASGFGGDMVVYPTNARDLQNSVVLLDRDATSMEAKRELYVWIASFRADARGRHRVYVQGSGDTLGVAIWNQNWREIDRYRGTGPSAFLLGAGRFHVGVDTRQDGALARIRGTFTIPWLWGERLTLSSLLVAAGEEPQTREQAVHAMPADLTFPVTTPLALYAEIYNLPATQNGISEFEVEYRFEPIDRGQPVVIAFDRRTLSRPTVVEQLVLEPARVPPGRYRIVLTVRDRLFGVEAQTSRVDLRLRSP